MTTITRANIMICCAGCQRPIELVLGLSLAPKGKTTVVLHQPAVQRHHQAASPACRGAGITLPSAAPACARRYADIRAALRRMERAADA